jgi:hypothetical protein
VICGWTVMRWAVGAEAAKAGAVPIRPPATKPAVASRAAPIEARAARDLLIVRTLHSLVTSGWLTSWGTGSFSLSKHLGQCRTKASRLARQCTKAQMNGCAVAPGFDPHNRHGSYRRCIRPRSDDTRLNGRLTPISRLVVGQWRRDCGSGCRPLPSTSR